MDIAVIGTGISGLAAAWALAERHSVTVYEAEDRLGGHTATVDVDYDGTPIAVDTGFIVYNTLNYPNLTAFFDHLGVETHASDMSFAVSVGNGKLEWAGHEGQLWRLFAQPSNLFRPHFLWMLKEITRFNGQSVDDLQRGRLLGLSLGDYLTARGYSVRFQTDYLIPMGAAIWSTSVERMLDFPAENFVRFFANHKLLGFDRPQWRTVTGGSRRYIAKLVPRLEGAIRLSSRVVRVQRAANGVAVADAQGHTALYDQVIVATHSDQALALLADASEAERQVLGDIRYADNEVILHRDPALMPRRKAAWSSWNYLSWPSTRPGTDHLVAVTYWMNKLQGIDTRHPLFVSLNPPVEPSPDAVFGRYRYAHPQLDGPAMTAQKRLPEIQGVNRTWFAGAWTGYGFHEDGLVSAIKVAEALGGRYPWRMDQDPAARAPLETAA